LFFTEFLMTRKQTPWLKKTDAGNLASQVEKSQFSGGGKGKEQGFGVEDNRCWSERRENCLQMLKESSTYFLSHNVLVSEKKEISVSCTFQEGGV